ncbi:MAG: hypothetical protein JSV09_13515 [Thermoplasmata archaeon]|nr:MAG: hypothetical protein JSV09_13515 [Thermoplasmata archaeon]
MSWKRITILIFLTVVLLNILQINIFLLYVYNSQIEEDGVSSEVIPLVWYAEIFLGIVIGLVYIANYLSHKKRKLTLPSEDALVETKSDVNISSSVGYNSTNLFYEVMIDNRSAFPLSDVVITPYLSKKVFTLEDDKKRIPLIRPYDSETVKFSVIPKPEEQGEADVLGRINYYNTGLDEYEERLLKPEAIGIKWPELEGIEIENNEWENIMSTLFKVEETVEDIPVSGEKCRTFALDIVNNRSYEVSSEIIKKDTYMAKDKFYAGDEKGLKYGVELIVTAKKMNEKPSQLKVIVYAENKESLVWLYYLIFHEINKALEKIEIDLEILREKEIAEAKISATAPISVQAMEAAGQMRDLFEEFDILKKRVETIEKDKIGVDSKFKSLYELDELYKILAEDLVKRKIVDIKAGEEIVKKRLTRKQIKELKRFKEAYNYLCEAETSDTVLTRKDFPNSGKKAILLVYFNAVEVYVRERLKELLPKGVTVLLGENHGHINTRKKDWEKNWAVLSLGSCIHIINNNGYLFLKNEILWKQKVETLMHQVRDLRNTVAHPSKENPDPKLVREKVYQLLKELPEVLKYKE